MPNIVQRCLPQRKFLLLSMGDSGSAFSDTLLLSTVPLALVVKATVLGNAAHYHFNHHFSLLYSLGQEKEEEGRQGGSPTTKEDEARRTIPPPSANLVLELHAYFKHNYGITSLAGCGTMVLPSEPGTHDLELSAWKPIACHGHSETRCRMHAFYLGSCLSDIGPLDEVPTSESEGDVVSHASIGLFSKGGLVSDGSGSILVSVSVAKNYFIRSKAQAETPSEREGAVQHQAKVRETVDEVLSRVRRNKRGRMARVYTSSSAESTRVKGVDPAKWDHSGFEEAKRCDFTDRVSSRTAEVLERVRSRKQASTYAGETQ